MNAIRIRTTVRADTLRIPQLRALLGQKVEILVLSREGAAPGRAKRDGRRRVQTGWFSRHFGAGWPGGARDGFEKAVARWRREDRASDLRTLVCRIRPAVSPPGVQQDY